jgi:drug/metabolite transporter (DMT)-like permease
MGVLLALASAVFYGMADFTGGLLSRRAYFATVALLGQVGGLVLTLAIAPYMPGSSPRAADLGWGALSGVGTGLGMVFLYRGLSRGAMSVVVPVSAVSGVVLPVLTGVAALGDRPSALSWAGIVAALPALCLVAQEGGADESLPAHRSSPGSPENAGASFRTPPLDALIAGVGIALQYLALAQVAPKAGVWPVAAGRAAAVITVLPLALSSRRRTRSRISIAQTVAATATGMLAAGALVFYLLSVREQLVVIAVVLSSLYPAIPVLLGITVLRERLRPLQAAGLVGAAVAVAFLTAG